jgi:hypothetical protein
MFWNRPISIFLVINMVTKLDNWLSAAESGGASCRKPVD